LEWGGNGRGRSVYKQPGTRVDEDRTTQRELAEEMEHRKDTVESLGQSLKETIPAEFKERAQQAVQDSVQIVEEGKRWLGHVRAWLEFRSADSEAGVIEDLWGREQRRTLGANPREGRRRRGAERRRAACRQTTASQVSFMGGAS
jgi:hypothetical protein